MPPTTHARADEALFSPGPTKVMGIINVTPDSFSETTHRTWTQAIDFGIELAAQGAQILDVGGMSTRPGAKPVDQAEEIARVVPVVEALAAAGLVISVDTMHAAVAQAVLKAGARIINDVTGGLSDPQILTVTAQYQAGYVLQHWRTPFDHSFTHVDVVPEVCAELTKRAYAAMEAGIAPEQLILDPGVGFGKTAAQNWELLANVDRIAALGFPVMWGVSRKRFLSEAYDHATEPWQRDAATAAVTALLASKRVWAVRTHTVAEHRAAVAVAEAVRGAGETGIQGCPT
ncbi:MAG: dihydropteroate synthase [Propionibacteriaceae bacterium]|nr:dihydropteroate synthase [Propionibacteriaceae bacterium]